MLLFEKGRFRREDPSTSSRPTLSPSLCAIQTARLTAVLGVGVQTEVKRDSSIHVCSFLTFSGGLSDASFARSDCYDSVDTREDGGAGGIPRCRWSWGGVPGRVGAAAEENAFRRKCDVLDEAEAVTSRETRFRAVGKDASPSNGPGIDDKTVERAERKKFPNISLL